MFAGFQLTIFAIQILLLIYGQNIPEFILNCLIHTKVILIYFTEHDIAWLNINGYCFNIFLTQLSAFTYLIVIYNSLLDISFQGFIAYCISPYASF